MQFLVPSGFTTTQRWPAEQSLTSTHGLKASTSP
jgi:hypothetical protein